MSMILFDTILAELDKKLNYDAIVNYAGNGFCEKSWEMIRDAYPLGNGKKTGTNAVASFFENATIIRNGDSASSDKIGPTK